LATINKSDVIKFISSLAETEAVDVCYQALKNRGKKVDYPNGDFEVDDVYCISMCTFGSFEGVIDKEAIVELFAPPVFSFDEVKKNYHLSQQGRCSLCKVNLISYVKRVICPVCGTENGLT
jgi:hypothetical protein